MKRTFGLLAKMAFLAIPTISYSAPIHPQSELKSLRMHYIENYLEEAAAAERLEPALLRAIIQVESHFNHKAVSPVGARGLMQIMPETAESVGNVAALDKHNPRANIMAGAHYLRGLINKFRGNLKLAIAAYNAGPNAVLKYNGMPPYTETRLYVRKVFQALEQQRKIIASSSSK